MKNYMKPVVLTNDELAEGVFAASGDCMTVEVTKGSRNEVVNGTQIKEEFKVTYRHKAWMDHCNTGNKIKIRFSTNVQIAEVTQGVTVNTHSGTEFTFTVSNPLHADGVDHSDFIVVVVSDAGSVSVVSKSISDANFRIVDDHIDRT